MEIQAFAEDEWDKFVMNLVNQIKSQIESQKKDYILSVDETEYKNYLFSEYELEELEIIKDTEEIIPNISKQIEHGRSGRPIERDIYIFEIRYTFKGSPFLFRLHPNHFTVVSNKIFVDDKKMKVSYSFKMDKRDATQFEGAKREGYHDSFINVSNINAEVIKWNAQLPNIISNNFDHFKQKYLAENDFFKEINAKVDANTSTIYTVPTIKKKIIPKPEASLKEKYHNFPSMSMEMYLDVIKVIYSAGKAMERKPSLYKEKDEEGLRDQFLYILETRYEGTTATGETFNRNGKTDILLKFSNDGSNLFVAECKFWHGKEEFFKAIDQLFNNYLTWRDSKSALMVFVTNKDFTNVLNIVKKEIHNHPLFIKGNGSNGDTSLSYIFSLPQDKMKEIFFEVMLFHLDR